MAIQARGPAWRLRDRIERELTERGWTDAEFYRETGVPRSTLDRLGRSLRPPQRKTVRKLAEAFGIDIGEALVLAGLIDEEESADDEPPGPPLHDAEERKMWDLLVHANIPAELAVAQLELFRATRQQAK